MFNLISLVIVKYLKQIQWY